MKSLFQPSMTERAMLLAWVLAYGVVMTGQSSLHWNESTSNALLCSTMALVGAVALVFDIHRKSKRVGIVLFVTLTCFMDAVGYVQNFCGLAREVPYLFCLGVLAWMTFSCWVGQSSSWRVAVRMSVVAFNVCAIIVLAQRYLAGETFIPPC